jgi:hypothetical protein
MMSYVRISIVLLAVVIVGSSCGEVEGPLPEALLDTDIISGPEDDSVVIESSATFQWKGSNKLVGAFSYRYTPRQENWSVWSPEASVTLEYLDQGDYVFEVKGRYEPGNEDDIPARRAFTVDIPGPGVLLKPFKQKAILGKEFRIDVVADEVSDMVLAHLILKFEPAQLQVLDVTPGEVFQGGRLPAFFETIDNSRGIVDISMSTIGATPSKIDGTGIIATIRFRSVSSGETDVTFDSGSELRDSKNRPIGITNRIGGIVEILESSP